MGKAPEELAQIYINNLAIYKSEHLLARSCFLAGYKAAKEQLETEYSALVSKGKVAMQTLNDQLADAGKVMPDTCDHILDATKMVDVNSLNNSKSWISVKNEMPPKDMLVYFYAPKKGFYPNVLFGFWDNDRWYVGGEVRPILSKDVTHWMYIPESPKEEPYQEAVEDIDRCERVPDYNDDIKKYIRMRVKKDAF